MGEYRIISSDDHVFEPADLWTSRIEGRFRERVPRVERAQDGTDWWYCDGIRGMNMAQGTGEGVRFAAAERLTVAGTLENVRPGGYIPVEHIKDMDMDGIDVSVTYPTEGLVLYTVPDGELLNATFRAYNDWLAEFCSAFPRRIKGVAMINLDNLQDGVKELERCAGIGLAGAMITVYPPEERSYDLPEYDPFWAAAQDLGMPISLHVGTIRVPPGSGPLDFNALKPGFTANVDHWPRMSLAHMIFSGVFERYPKLQVGAVEVEVSWVPHFLDRIDYTYTQHPIEFAPYRYKEDMLPSDYFHRNVFLSVQQDALGIKLREIIGVDNLLWGSDYPHMEGTFPKSQEILEEILADCTEEEKAKIAGQNAARVYGLS